MFKRILVPLDTSVRAESALPVAVRIAHATGAALILLRVISVPVEYGPYLLQSGNLMQELLDAEDEDAQSYLKGVAAREHLAGLQITTISVTGSAAQSILATITDHNVDLVVMCSHGTTGVRRWVLGSVAQKIVRHSPASVLILREGGMVPGATQSGVLHALRVMVALDGSPLSEESLRPAAELAVALSPAGQAALHLTRVLHLPTGHEHDALTEQALKDAKDYLGNIGQCLREGVYADLHLHVSWSVAIDTDIAGRLIKIAEGEEGLAGGAGCDVIALATHGRGGLQRWTMGSVTERVLGATKLPLLVVRPEAVEEHQAASSREQVASKS
jgi:nucleotide-binding universal stress UspA family protein